MNQMREKFEEWCKWDTLDERQQILMGACWDVWQIAWKACSELAADGGEN